MKKMSKWKHGGYRHVKKFLLIMKLTFLVSFLGIMSLSASTYSQKTKLSVDLKTAPITEVLKSIEDQSEFVFIYESDVLDFDKKISLMAKEVTVDRILAKVFKNTGITYEIHDKQVVLTKESDLGLRILSPLIKNELQSIQKKKISGTVYDEEGKPVPGASVVIKGTAQGTITDADGAFHVEVVPGAVLSISFIGYQAQEIQTDDKSVVHVILQTATKEIEDVMVVAFGKQKKESVMSSITTINPEKLKIPSSNLTTALAGRIAGIISYQRSGEPGQDNADFFIRGVTTFGYKKDPLILIDGAELGSEVLAKLQPDDIKSFSIMKDATATALYGARGANGVILITTKEGIEGKTKVNVRFENSISMPTRNLKLADGITYMKLHNEAVKTRDPLGILPYSPEKIANTQDGKNPVVYPLVDWMDMLFKNFTNNQRVNMNITGGGKKARYYLAATVNRDNGILKNEGINDFNNNIRLTTCNVRSNTNMNLTGTTEVVVRMHATISDYNGPITGGDGIYQKALKANPVLFPAYYLPDEENKYANHILFGNYGNGNYYNPYADMVRGYKDYRKTLMLVQFELKQDLSFLTKGLSSRVMVNTTRDSYYDVSRHYTPYYYGIDSYDKTTDTYTLDLLNEGQGTEYLDYDEGQKIVNSQSYLEAAVEYNTKISSEHGIGALLVYTMNERLVGNAGDLQKSLPYRNMGLAGRFTYSYSDKYFGEFNFGYNGSERFHEDRRFGFFPSIGVGYLISKESFFQNLEPVIPKLKLKATYGLVGNDAIGSEDDRFFYLSNVNINDPERGASFGTHFASTPYSRNGVSISRYANEDITWEIAKKMNAGFELGMFKNSALEIQADFFTEHRSNILMDRAYIPITMGLQATPRANVGKSSGKGIDISVNYNMMAGEDFWLTGMGNFTYATSKFTAYEEPNYSAIPWRSCVGRKLSQKWGLIAERLFVDEEEIDNSPIQNFGLYEAGDIKYRDINRDGQITRLDEVPVGYPTSPEIVYGFGFSMGYKNIDLSCFFQGLANESFWIDANAMSPFIDTDAADGVTTNNALLQVIADSHWSEERPDINAFWPRLSTVSSLNNSETSTWYMRNGSFLRLKTLEIGYSFPQRWVNRCKIQHFRIYATGSNLLTFSKFDLWDPEMGSNGFGYPIQKVYNIGLQVSF
ncbi:MAG: TonB-dependent receptor [Mangrovibacterium sp.]